MESSMAKMTFGENLKALMEAHRLSVSELAKGLGESPKTVQEWVGSGGRTPRKLEAIRKLADYFECSIHFLLYGEEDPKSALGILMDKTEIHTGLYEITIKKVSTKERR